MDDIVDRIDRFVERSKPLTEDAYRDYEDLRTAVRDTGDALRDAIGRRLYDRLVDVMDEVEEFVERDFRSREDVVPVDVLLDLADDMREHVRDTDLPELYDRSVTKGEPDPERAEEVERMYHAADAAYDALRSIAGEIEDFHREHGKPAHKRFGVARSGPPF